MRNATRRSPTPSPDGQNRTGQVSQALNTLADVGGVITKYLDEIINKNA